jgi:hypothetical protein
VITAALVAVAAAAIGVYCQGDSQVSAAVYNLQVGGQGSRVIQLHGDMDNTVGCTAKAANKAAGGANYAAKGGQVADNGGGG